MIVAIFPALIALAGALVYGISSNSKAQELGRGAFWAGMFALCFSLAAHTVRIG